MARICVGEQCDFNADGRSDIRDLVLMVHCVNHEGPCPDGAAHRFDCNGDSAFTIDDVLCCATNILLRHRPPGDSLPGRHEPDVHVRLDPPVQTTAGVDLAVHVRGANRLGGMSLKLDYPWRSLNVAGLEFQGVASQWLHLYQVQARPPDAAGDVPEGSRLAVGLILTSGVPNPAFGELTFVVHFATRPGSDVSGAVTVEEGEFTGPDGAPLSVDLGRPSQPVGSSIALSLGANRPNPFSVSTRFSAVVPASQAVSVGVYDVRGRRVAELWNGTLPQGEREFQWDGRTADGALAPSGIYFYRLTSQGAIVSRKMILMRRN